MMVGLVKIAHQKSNANANEVGSLDSAMAELDRIVNNADAVLAGAGVEADLAVA